MWSFSGFYILGSFWSFYKVFFMMTTLDMQVMLSQGALLPGATTTWSNNYLDVGARAIGTLLKTTDVFIG